MKSLLKIFNLTLVLSFIFVCYPAVGKTIKLSSNSPEVSKSVNQVAPESGEDLDEIEFVEMLNSVPLDAKVLN